MKTLLQALIAITLIKSSYQWCRSTVGFTTCGNEKLTKNKPLKITDYKPFLDFGSGNLEEIPSGSFQFLPEITTLYISDNHIKKIEAGAFDGLHNLQKLVLFSNELTDVNEGMFRNCRNLKHLDLRHNKITNVESDAFDDLTSLQELNLGWNSLQTVPAAVNKIKSLTHLKLDYNRLTSLSGSPFNNLNKLQVLDLSDNQINAISNGAFSGLEQLQELNLKSNYLSNLNARDVLADLRSLAVVRLAVNSFNCRDLNAVVEVFKRTGVEVAKGVSKSQDTVEGMGCKKM